MKKLLLYFRDFVIEFLGGNFIIAYNIVLFFIVAKIIAYNWLWLLLFVPIAFFATITFFINSLTFIGKLSVNNTLKIWQLLDNKQQSLTHILYRRVTHGILYAIGITFLFLFPLDAITTSIGQGLGYYLGASITFISIIYWIKNSFV